MYIALTLAEAEDVGLLGEEHGEPLHQQQGFVVALNGQLPLVEHLIQRSGLNLRSNTEKSSLADSNALSYYQQS